MGQRLGLRVDKEDGEIFVLEVQHGLVQEWNEANPDSQVWGRQSYGRRYREMGLESCFLTFLKNENCV